MKLDRVQEFSFSIIQLMRIDRPIGTVLLVCPTLWALWLTTNGRPSASLVFIFLLGAFIMRSAGCVINDFADSKIDIKVKRTKDRPLTSGKISERATIILFILLILSAFILLLFLPRTAILPAFFALSLAVIYPFSKRFFIIPQLILGLAYGAGIIIVYRVNYGFIPVIGWLLFLSTAIWTMVYDTFYAMVDRDDDMHLQIHSSALLFAQYDLLICAIFTLIFILLMIIVGIISSLGIFYYIGILMASICFLYQFWISRTRNRQKCLAAFMNNQWVGLLIFLGILLETLPQ